MTVQVETRSILDDIRSNLDYIMEDVENIEVANHSAVGGEWVTIADMADADIARNNCWAASNEIYENLEVEEYANIAEVDIVGVVAEGVSHYAVYLANEEEEVVLDFTARQFDPTAPFPYVVPLNVWHGYLEHMTGKPMTVTIGD